MKFFRVLFLLIFIFELFSVYFHPVYAQTPTPKPTVSQNVNSGGGAEASIKRLLCAPTNTSDTGYNAASGDLYLCINKLYRFAIAFSSVFAVFMIVIAGYLYMASDGNEESVTKAKEILVSTITAMVILAIAFLLLEQINPELVKFKTIQPTFVSPSASTGAGRNPSYGGGTGGGSCTATTNNLCSTEVLKSACNWDPTDASKVCNVESGGGRDGRICSGYDICTTTGRPGGPPKRLSNGEKMSFSCGTFQINLTKDGHGNASYMPEVCKNLFTGNNYNCNLPQANEARYQQCRDWLAVQTNILPIACRIYKDRRWQPWVTSVNKCGIR